MTTSLTWRRKPSQVKVSVPLVCTSGDTARLDAEHDFDAVAARGFEAAGAVRDANLQALIPVLARRSSWTC